MNGEALTVSGRKALQAALGVLSAALLVAGIRSGSRKKRVFVSFAVEDKAAREHLRGQALNSRTPLEFTDMGLDKPFTARWKTQCRELIRSCDGVIVLLSKKTWNADGARWEIKCAIEEGKPVLGVHIHRTDKGAVPPELPRSKVIEWTWDGITRFIDSL